MAALAPHGLIGNRGRLSYDITGKGRSQVPSSGIGRKVADTVNSLFPGTKTSMFSGQEPKGRAPVGARDRHPKGYAGDFDFFDPAGNQITDKQKMHDIAMAMAAKYGANIGYSQTGYMGPGSMHIDTMPVGPGGFPGGAQWADTAKSWAGNLDFARETGIGPTPYDAPTPFSPDQPNPNNLRPSMLDGIPANGLNGVSRSPLGPVSMSSSPLSPTGFSGALMSPTSLSSLSPSAVSSMAAMTAPRGPVASPVARAPDMAAMPSTASLSPVSMTSTPMSPANVSSPMAPSATSFGPAPAPGPMPGPSPTNLASAYGQLGSTLAQAGVTLAGMPAPNAVVAMPSALPAPNAPVAMPPAPVQQPVPQPLPPPVAVPRMPMQSLPEAPPAPRSFSPADIYGGQVGQATASDGSTVGRDPFGRTTVTNRYGVTTAMTPDGKQAAYGGMPGPGGKSSLFGGMQMSPKAGGILGGLLGAAAGTMVAGPAGGLIGGLIGKSVLGGGLLGGGGGFPSAPARSNVDYRNTERVNFNGFGSGRNASGAEANRGGGGVTSGGTGLW